VCTVGVACYVTNGIEIISRIFLKSHLEGQHHYRQHLASCWQPVDLLFQIVMKGSPVVETDLNDLLCVRVRACMCSRASARDCTAQSFVMLDAFSFQLMKCNS